MPTNRNRLTRTRGGSAGVSDQAYLHFTKGAFFTAEDYESGKSLKQLKDFWFAHKDEIMQRYSERNRIKGLPAVRPWVYWEWDMPEPQQDIEPMQHDSQKRWDHTLRVHRWCESDEEYLMRLNLLEPWELELLSR